MRYKSNEEFSTLLQPLFCSTQTLSGPSSDNDEGTKFVMPETYTVDTRPQHFVPLAIELLPVNRERNLANTMTTGTNSHEKEAQSRGGDITSG